MSTLNKEAIKTMNLQIENAKGKFLSKKTVLLVLHDKLKEIDQTNPFIVDRIDGSAVKNLINHINKLPEK